MNPDIFTDLIGIAEIATVFIGFAVLISVVSPSLSNRVQVMGIVIGAAMVLIACLLPILLRTFEDSPSLIARISSITFIVINTLTTFAMFRWVPGMSQSVKSEASISIIVWAFEAIMYLLFMLCVFNIWSQYIITFYFAAVFVLLIQIIFLFLILTISLSQSVKENDV